MGEVLRGAQMDPVSAGADGAQELLRESAELFEKAYRPENGLVCWPVRHHSPACSIHLAKVIRAYRPDIVLVEGPEEANTYIPVLLHEETKPPLAFYYSYHDSGKYIAEEAGEYRCYYPFLEYSPELVALREAAALGVESGFMDLSYAQILIGSAEGARLLRKGEKESYNDDYLLSENTAIQELCRKKGLRGFHEFWEKYFEIGGLHRDTKDFMRDLLFYCLLSRKNTSREELLRDGCLLRERFMAGRIAEQRKQGKRVLAVMGGFHVRGVLAFLGEYEPEETKLPALRKSLPEKDCAVYVMPYSEEQADQLNGYASGMPHPAYYHRVWEAAQAGSETPFTESSIDFLIRCGKAARQKDAGISTFDEICGVQMMEGLSALRGKPECGVFELSDGVLSCFVKGERDISSEIPLLLLKRQLSGRRTGSLWSGAPIPPILQDFQQKCRDYQIKINTTVKSERTLDIFTTKRHREISCFLHQLVFLETGFAVMLKGPQLAKGTGKNLIRETWQWQYLPAVTAELIDKSVYGGTVEEAAKSWLKRRMEENAGSEEGSRLCIHSMEMGMPDLFFQILAKLREWISEETSFDAMAACLFNLSQVEERQEMYRIPENTAVSDMVRGAYEKLILMLPGIASCREEEQEKRLKSLRSLYRIAQKTDHGLDSQMLYEGVRLMLQQPDLNPAIHGAGLGILYGFDRDAEQEILFTLGGYLRGTHEKMLAAASFFRGLFDTAKDLVFVNPAFLEAMDGMLRQIGEPEFLEMIPNLRLAFCYFTPSEIDSLGGRIASLYGKKDGELLAEQAADPYLFALGERIEAWAEESLRQETGEAG